MSHEHGPDVGTTAAAAAGSADTPTASRRADDRDAAAVEQAFASDPSLTETLKRLFDDGRGAAGEARDTAGALLDLGRAEWALTRTAVAQAALLAGLAAVFALVTLALAAATTASLLVAAGLGWLPALALTGAGWLAITALLGWRALRSLQAAGFSRLRRELERIRSYGPWA